MPRPPSLVSWEALAGSNHQELLQNLVAQPPPGTWGDPSRTDLLVAARDTSLSSLYEGREKGLEFGISLCPMSPTLLLATAACVSTVGLLPCRSFQCPSLRACHGLSEYLHFVYVKWNLPEARFPVFPEKAIVWVITIPENIKRGRFYVLSLI